MDVTTELASLSMGRFSGCLVVSYHLLGLVVGWRLSVLKRTNESEKQINLECTKKGSEKKVFRLNLLMSAKCQSQFLSSRSLSAKVCVANTIIYY